MQILRTRGRAIAIGLVALACVLGGSYAWRMQMPAAPQYQTPEEADTAVRFAMEVRDIIHAQYWQKSTDAEMAELFRQALVRTTGDPSLALPSPDRTGTAQMLAHALALREGAARRQLAVDTSIAALSLLPPEGRSGLLTTQQEQAMRDTAANIDRSRDLYATLGVPQGAPAAQVSEAFASKKQELEAQGTPESAAALEEISYAHEVLSATTSKALYDTARIEPSASSRMLDAQTLYLDLRQVTPGSFAEFQSAILALGADSPVRGIIIDLRGNIGGTLDFAKYVFALFVGPNQYAFDLFHQGDLAVERTPIDVFSVSSLTRVRDVAILVDGMTQSTAELLAAIFQRSRIGLVVGEKTRGWGSVENTFPLTTDFGDGTRYAVLLVHSVTIRPDGQSIEGNGITPDVDMSSPQWRIRLGEAFRSRAFADALAALLAR